MNYFILPLLNSSFSTSTQAHHVTNSSHIRLISTTQPVHGSTNKQLWHSGISPDPHKLVEKPREVIRFYVSGYIFTKKYNNPSHNLVMQHVWTK